MEACVDMHFHAPVPPLDAIVGRGSGAPWGVRSPCIPLLSCLWGPQTLFLRAGGAGHFSGKYKKPSSGQLEGVGLGFEV